MSWRRKCITIARMHLALARAHTLQALRTVGDLRDCARAGDMARAWDCALLVESYREEARRARRDARDYFALAAKGAS